MTKRLPPSRRARNRVEKEDHSFRLGGRTGRIGRQTEFIQWSPLFRNFMRRVKETGRRNKNGGKSPKGGGPTTRVFRQRVAVRVRYSKPKGKGQFRAHGAYIQRESANAAKSGFDQVRNDVPIAETLDGWQKQDDELLWKIIISPENGQDMNLEEHTRKVMQQMEKDLGQPLEWTAAVHRNTAKPHVHIALRGKDKAGNTVILPPDYVKQGLRQRSADLATMELGHRFEADIVHSQRLQIMQGRFTDLDRNITKRADQDGCVYVNTANPDLKGLRLATELHCEQRLYQLRDMGLAAQIGNHTWKVDRNLEKALRARQQANDRQKIMQQFGVMASDKRVPFVKTEWRHITKLEGRILVHGQEDQAHRSYMLLEDVNGKIHFLDHRPEIEKLRQAGKLQPDSYAAMRVVWEDRKPRWIVEDYGSAAEALRSDDFIDHCLRRGVHPPAHGFGGWLGQFRDAIERARHMPEKAEGESERVFHMPGAANAKSEATPKPERPTPPIVSVRKSKRPLISMDEARQQFRDALFEMGLIVEGDPIMDGKLHRVPVFGGKKGNKSGRYIGHLDEFPAGYIENLKMGEKTTWKADGVTRALSAEERREAKERREREKLEQEADRQKTEIAVAKRSAWRWNQAKPALRHDYLIRKNIDGVGLRVDVHGNLLVPMKDVDGKVWGVQSIKPDGTKLYPKGVRKLGTYFVLGQIDPAGTVILAEGVATGKTVQRASGLPVVSVFDSGNLLAVAKALRSTYPSLRIGFAADNDHHLPRKVTAVGRTLPNVGLEKANDAAREVGGFVVAPHFSETDDGTDWNDYAKQHGLEAAAVALRNGIWQAAADSVQPRVSEPMVDTESGRPEAATQATKKRRGISF